MDDIIQQQDDYEESRRAERNERAAADRCLHEAWERIRSSTVERATQARNDANDAGASRETPVRTTSQRSGRVRRSEDLNSGDEDVRWLQSHIASRNSAEVNV